jgi:hypothetical protein
MAKRIDDTSSTASATPRRRVVISIPVVLIDLDSIHVSNKLPGAYNKKGSLPTQLPSSR